MSVVQRARRGGSSSSSGEPQPAMLLLHGFGSNEDDLIDLVPMLDAGLPWASPRAPIELGGGAATWFPVRRPGGPEPGAVEEATDALWSWVATELGDEAVIVPIGFSQGGSMALQLLRTRPTQVLAPAVLSGFLHGGAVPLDALLEAMRPAAFWGRGSADPIVDLERVERTASWLARHTTPELHVYPGVGHAIVREELADLRRFLAQALRSRSLPTAE